jgi:hypothetical protein
MTLVIPKHLEQRLEILSKQQGKSEQELLELMLETMLAETTPTKRHNRRSIGMGKSGIGDLSERIDELAFPANVLEYRA